MNEQELKQIWRTEEAIPLKNIDMEFIQQYTNRTQNTLQNLSSKELVGGLVLSAIFAFDFIYSGNFYIVLLATLIYWIYTIWKNRREMERDEFNRTHNVRDFLIGKEKSLTRQIAQQRAFSLPAVLVLIPLANILNGTFYERLAHPLRYSVVLIFTLIAVQIIIEFYVRRYYKPILEDLRYLIEQFDEDENAR